MDKEILSLVIVEDEEIMLRELINAIDWQRLGIKIIATCRDGEEGERVIKEKTPDIVITDIRLPKQNGLEMLSHCPMLYQNVLVLSGFTNFQYTRKAIQLGVFDYLEKPVEDEELEKIADKLASRIREEHKEERKMGKEGKDAIALPTEVENHQIKQVISFIKEMYKKQISHSDAAEHVKLTENHLSTLFKECTGINYLQYLNAYRINRAIDLMKNSSYNISEISAETGFPNSGYFARLFKRYTGLTPREYRDKL